MTVPKKLNKFLRLDVEYFAKNYSILMIKNGTMAVIGFVTSLFFANFLSKSVFGTYSYIQSVVALVSIISLSGLNTSMTKAVSEKDTEALPESTGLTFLLSIVGTITLIAFGVYGFFQNRDSNLLYGMMAAGIWLPFSHSFNFYFSVLAARSNFVMVSWIFTLRQFLTNVLLIVCIMFKPSVVGLVFILYAVSSLVDVYFSWKYGLFSSPIASYFPKLKNVNVRLGIKLSVYGSLMTVATMMDKFLVGTLLSYKALALYSVAVALPEFFKGIIKEVQDVAFVKLGVHGKKEVKKNLYWHSLILVLGISSMVGAYVLAAPYFFRWFYPQYIEAVGYSQVYALSIIATAALLISNYFARFQEEKKILYANTIHLVITLALYLFLIPRFGLWGAIWGKVISRFTNSFIKMAFLHVQR